MNKNETYAGIDYCRIIAALLVVAIHTSPLSSFTATGDFILTRIIARLAVPFFLMTSGFFLVSKSASDAKRLWAFVKKTTVIYGVAILICLPINFYNNYFGMDNLIPNIIKDIVFDGTLYHLWYLPASVIGAIIAWFTVKKLGYPLAFATTSILYLIGILGDSYYGITEAVPYLNGFYDLIFTVTDYTRNGLFFAPIFFVMSGFIADKDHHPGLKKSLLGFVISLALMFGEALVLRNFELQRHDSMYLFLLPVMYFLFNSILCLKGKRPAYLRTVSLIIYIIHPLMIVAVRFASKLIGLQWLFIENSAVHFLSVVFASAVFAVASTVLWKKCRRAIEKKRISQSVN